MLFKILVVFSCAFGLLVAQDDPKPNTTTIITSKPPTPDSTNSTPRFTTEQPYPTSPIYPLCCGKNEMYLPPRIAPYCQVYCKDIGQECDMRFDMPEPYGCHCKPGFCRGKDDDCISFYDAFNKCHY